MKTVSKDYSLLILIIVFCVCPYQFFSYNNIISSIVNILLSIFSFIYIFLILKNKKRIHFGISGFFILFFVMFQSIVSFHYNSIPFTPLLILIERFFLIVCVSTTGVIGSNSNKLFNTVSLYYFVGIAINTLCVFIYPEGIFTTTVRSGNIHEVYFLGIDNQFGGFVFPGFSFIWYNDVHNKNSYKNSIIAFIMIAATYFRTKSGTGMIVVMLLLAVFVLCMKDSKIVDKIITAKSMIIIIVVFCALLVTGDLLIYSNSFIGNAISNFTGKNMTFSGRTTIWQNAIEMFLRSPIVGYGRRSDNVFIYLGAKGFNCHNIVLQILLESGACGLSIFIAFIISVGKASDKCVKLNKHLHSLQVGLLTTLLYFCFEVGSISSFAFLAYVLYLASYNSLLMNNECSLSD